MSDLNEDLESDESAAWDRGRVQEARDLRPFQLLKLRLRGQDVDLAAKGGQDEIKNAPKVALQNPPGPPPLRQAPTPRQPPPAARGRPPRAPGPSQAPPPPPVPAASKLASILAVSKGGRHSLSVSGSGSSSSSAGGRRPRRPGSFHAGSGSSLYPDERTATELKLAQVEEEAEQDRRKLKIALFWIMICLIGFTVYAMHAMDEIRRNVGVRHEQKVAAVAAMFPKNPYEYNERQRRAYAKNFWRRFNFRNLSILGVATIGSIYVAKWHRQRRVQIHKRKTIAFWLWTAVSGIIAIAWGVYIVKKSQTPIIVKQVKRNPVLRGFLYIGSILVVALSWYAYRISLRKSKKQIYVEKWRKKKAEQTMKKMKDKPFYFKPFKMDPLGKTQPKPYKASPPDPRSTGSSQRVPSSLAYKPA